MKLKFTFSAAALRTISPNTAASLKWTTADRSLAPWTKDRLIFWRCPFGLCRFRRCSVSVSRTSGPAAFSACGWSTFRGFSPCRSSERSRFVRRWSCRSPSAFGRVPWRCWQLWWVEERLHRIIVRILCGEQKLKW